MATNDIGIRVVILGVGEARRSIGSVKSDLSGMERQIRSLSGTTTAFTKSLSKLGGALAGFGRTLSLFVTTPIIGAGGALVAAGIEFDDTFAGIGKTVDGVSIGVKDLIRNTPVMTALITDFQNKLNAKGGPGQFVTWEDALDLYLAGLDGAQRESLLTADAIGELTPAGEELKQKIRELALEIPISVNELNEIGQVAGQLGVPLGAGGDTLLNFIEVVSKLGVATDLSTQDAAFALARIGNVFGVAGDDWDEFAAQAGATIVDLGNNVAATEPEITNMALRMASAGRLAGLTVPEILGLSATIAAVGVRSERGGTAVSRMFQEMTNAAVDGGDALETFAMIAGVSTDEFVTLFEKDALGALQIFIAGAQEMGEEGTLTTDMLTEIGLSGVRVQDVIRLLGLVQDDLAENVDRANLAWDQQLALEEEAAKRFKTTKSQLILLKNAFIDLGISIFELYKDDIENFISSISELVTRFKELDDGTKKQIVKYALIAAAIGPVIAALGLFLQSLSVIISSIIAVGSAAGTLLTILPFAALLYLAWSENFLGIKDIFNDVAKAFKDSNLGTEIQELIDSITSGDLEGAKKNLEDVFNEFSRIFKEGYPKAIARLRRELGFFFDVFDLAIDIGGYIKKIADALSDLTGVNSTKILIIGASLTWLGRKQLADGIIWLAGAIIKLAGSLLLLSLKAIVSGVTSLIGAFSVSAIVAAIPPLLVITFILLGIVRKWEDLKIAVGKFTSAIKSGDIEGAVSSFANIINTVLDGIKENLIEISGKILGLFGIDNIDERLAPWKTMGGELIKILFDPSVEGSLANRIVNFGNEIWEWLGIDANIDTRFAQPFRDAKKTVTEILGGLENAINVFANVVETAFGKIGNAIKNALVNSFQFAATQLINGLNIVIDALNNLPGVDIGKLDVPSWDNTGGFNPAPLIDSITTAVQATAAGAVPSPVPGRAKGGILRGLGIVGERGPEFAFSSGMSTIVPANLTTEMIRSMAHSNTLNSKLMQSVIQHRQPVTNTSIYNPIFNAPPTREMVQTNQSLYDQWIMANQGI